MRGFRMGGAIRGALAALSLGIRDSLDFRTKQPETKAEAPPTGSRGGYGETVYPHARSHQEPSKDRLLLDRSTSVRKMQRWLNAGTMQSLEPKTDRHLLRHGWYRRQKQREARVAAIAAWRAAS